jgi:hypothetical protein
LLPLHFNPLCSARLPNQNNAGESISKWKTRKFYGNNLYLALSSNFVLHVATLAAVIKLRIIRASITNGQISKSPSSHHIKGF